MDSTFYKKYLKYQSKYLELKNKLSQFGGLQTGGTICKACNQSEKCQYKLKYSKIDDKFFKQVDIFAIMIRKYIDTIETYIWFNNCYLQILCNLEAIIRIKYMKNNVILWSIFLLFYPYIRDEKECYNVFYAFYNKIKFVNITTTNYNDYIPHGYIDPPSDIQEKEELDNFFIFLDTVLKSFISEYITNNDLHLTHTPPKINDISININGGLSINNIIYRIPTFSYSELKNILTYFKKGSYDIFSSICLRQYSLTDIQLNEFNRFMSDYNLKDIESFSYFGFDNNLRITDVVIKIITEFTADQKNFLKRILLGVYHPYFNIYIAYYLSVKFESKGYYELEIKILSLLLYMLKYKYQNYPNLLNEIKEVNMIETYKWTEKDYINILKLYRFYRNHENQIKSDKESFTHTPSKIQEAFNNIPNIAHKLLHSIPLSVEEELIKERILKIHSTMSTV
jgi:hypothetical protein